MTGSQAATDASADGAPGDEDERLAGLCEQLCAIASETGAEAALADHLEQRYQHREPLRVGESLVVPGPGVTTTEADPATDAGQRKPLVVLCGHLDTVPATDEDFPPRRDDGRLIARGASDCKSGLAVAMDCFEDERLRQAPVRLALVGYAREEGPAADNQLPAVLEAAPWLAQAELAVITEPTGGHAELGCLGGIHASVTFRGSQAHSARPWLGRNALHDAASVLTDLARLVPVERRVDELAYYETCVATQGWTGSARNVAPGEFTLNVNVRFAPNRSAAEAEADLRTLVGDRAEVTVTDTSPAALPHASDPAVRAFLEHTGAEAHPKQAWTDIARFTGAGVPAVNFGPGDPAQAHLRGEWVELAALGRARRALATFLSHGPPPHR